MRLGSDPNLLPPASPLLEDARQPFCQLVFQATEPGRESIVFVLFAPGGIVGALRGRIGLRA